MFQHRLLLIVTPDFDPSSLSSFEVDCQTVPLVPELHKGGIARTLELDEVAALLNQLLGCLEDRAPVVGMVQPGIVAVALKESRNYNALQIDISAGTTPLYSNRAQPGEVEVEPPDFTWSDFRDALVGRVHASIALTVEGQHPSCEGQAAPSQVPRDSSKPVRLVTDSVVNEGTSVPVPQISALTLEEDSPSTVNGVPTRACTLADDFGRLVEALRRAADAAAQATDGSDSCPSEFTINNDSIGYTDGRLTVRFLRTK